MDGPSDQRRFVKASFVGHQQCSKSLDDRPEFRQGLRLKTIEKGVKFPVVHFGPARYYFGWENDLPKADLRSVISDGSGSILQQGVYQELASVRVDLFGLALDDVNGVNGNVKWNKFYLLLGFHQLPFRPFTETTEIHWKDWSLARYLFLNIPDDFGLSGLTFYKRHQPDDFGLFLYMVLVECAHIRPREELHLKDFVNRIRADKLPSYMALYTNYNDDNEWNVTREREFILRAEEELPPPPEELRLPPPISSSTPAVDIRRRSPQSPRRPISTQTRGTSPLPTPWFFMSHPQFLRRNQRHLRRSGDLDSVGGSEEGSLPMSPDARSFDSPSPTYYGWPRHVFDEF